MQYTTTKGVHGYCPFYEKNVTLTGTYLLKDSESSKNNPKLLLKSVDCNEKLCMLDCPIKAKAALTTYLNSTEET